MRRPLANDMEEGCDVVILHLSNLIIQVMAEPHASNANRPNGRTGCRFAHLCIIFQPSLLGTIGLLSIEEQQETSRCFALSHEASHKVDSNMYYYSSIHHKHQLKVL